MVAPWTHRGGSARFCSAWSWPAASLRPECKLSLASLVDEVAASGAHVILATHPPIIVDGAFADDPDPVADAIRDVATGRVLIDFDAAVSRLGVADAAEFYEDKAHLNEAGQPWLAEVTLQTLVPLLPS